jgi:hypothetical protein
MEIHMSGLGDTINGMETNIIVATLLLFVMSAITTFTIVRNRKLKKRIKVLAISLVRVEDLVNSAKLDNKDNEIHKENFIKFLSDSRDWAYLYIEDVQKGLTSFVNEIEPEIAYFDEYGLVGEAYPHYHSMKKISHAYKDLKKLLPEEDV